MSPWTKEEDEILIRQVREIGENDRWKDVASALPGRTNKACRKRWLHSLSPNIKKSIWTTQEDAQLIELYNAHPNKWSMIARQIPGRTDDACSKRYREFLDPNLKKDPWTLEEDARLLEEYQRLGGSWISIGAQLNRGSLACRNRWRFLQRNRDPAMQTQNEDRQLDDMCPPEMSVAQLNPPEVYITQDFPLEYDDMSSLYISPSFCETSDIYPPGASYQGLMPHSICSPLDHAPLDLNLDASVFERPSPISFSHASSSFADALLDPREFIQPASSIMIASSPDHLSPKHWPETSLLREWTSPSQTSSELAFALTEKLHWKDQPIQHESPQQFMTPSLPEPMPNPSLDATSTPSSESSVFPYADVGSQADELNAFMSPSVPSSTTSLSQALLSPDASPGSSSQGTLPRVPSAATPSVLFTPYYNNSRHAPKPLVARTTPEAGRVPVRLSGTLQMSEDETLKPYACGHDDCWPDNVSIGMATFQMANQLTEHIRVKHNNEIRGDKPFRCALEGCDKTWRTINGLLYHLQLSKSHPGVQTKRSAMAYVKRTQVFRCTRHGCNKEYRQMSGLKYHLNHGHPD